MALPANRHAVVAILAEISDRIIGQKRDGFSCSCGAIHCGPATAVSIDPGGDSYPGQETSIGCWSVNMRYHPEDPENRNGYGFCLSEFIPFEELEQIFKKHFGQIEQADNAWRLISSGSDRAVKKLTPAMKIRNNSELIEFSVDWGADQKTAKWFEKRSFASKAGKVVGALTFDEVLKKLKKVKALTYMGGPVPELEFESEWLEDFSRALVIAENSEQVIVRSGSYFDRSGKYITNTSFVFLKYPEKS